MDFGLKNKTALVLAAGGGLGRAIGMALSREGANLVLADVDAGSLKESKEAIEAAGGKVLSLQWDIGDLSSLEANFKTIEAHFGNVDILINNTGGPPPGTASDQSPGLWLKHFQSMVLSVISITDRALPGMRQKKWGRVITSTSSGVIAPIANLGMSNALRMSLVGWSKTLSREVGKEGITANIVLPGRVATDRIHFLDRAKAAREGRDLHDVIAESTGSIPVGRYGRPEEYADVVTFLASENASYVTGSVVRIDGGLIASA